MRITYTAQKMQRYGLTRKHAWRCIRAHFQHYYDTGITNALNERGIGTAVDLLRHHHYIRSDYTRNRMLADLERVPVRLRPRRRHGLYWVPGRRTAHKRVAVINWILHNRFRKRH